MSGCNIIGHLSILYIIKPGLYRNSNYCFRFIAYVYNILLPLLSIWHYVLTLWPLLFILSLYKKARNTSLRLQLWLLLHYEFWLIYSLIDYIGPAIFRFIGQCFIQLRYHVLQLTIVLLPIRRREKWKVLLQIKLTHREKIINWPQAK
jgi:hypothetical protein